ncbi:hypothetical protein [Nocardioides bigeumensis]
MKILMTNHALHARGGSESYLETVSTELRKLGHEVCFYSPSCGAMAESLRAGGFTVHDDVGDVPVDIDVIHGQHASAVGLVRTRLPRTPLVFVCHSWLVNSLEDPVVELAAAAHVVFNDLTLRRVRAHAAGAGVPVHRLTQPVSVSFGDGARSPVSEVPRRAVAVSRRMITLPARLAAACAELGIEFSWVGGPDSDEADARHSMFAADLVIGMGRTALEAMAAARPVLVMDEAFNAGWVTDASYLAIEADGFTGIEAPRAEPDLVRLLGQYDAALGTLGRKLVSRHHLAQHHAARLVEVYTAAADVPEEGRAAARDASTVAQLTADRFSLEDRLLRSEWRAASLERALAEALAERQHFLDELEVRRVHVSDLEKELDLVRGQRDQARERRQRTAKRLKQAVRERDQAQERLEQLSSASTGRFRLRRIR